MTSTRCSRCLERCVSPCRHQGGSEREAAGAFPEEEEVPEYSVQVDGFEPARRGRHVIYTLIIRRGTAHWPIRRRFRQVVKLHEQLLQSFGRYLSEDFFPGMHILEAVGAGRFHVFPRGQKAEPRLLQLEGVSFRKDRERLEQFLAPPPLEPLQLPWALFTPQGRPVADLRGLQESPLLFLLEIGQWMWPAVRVGFEHNVSDVHEGRVATLRTLSLRPVIFEVQNFMSDEETDQVMAFGAQQGLVSSKARSDGPDETRSGDE
ncbi:unnamed protein product [Effrenium voratum]|nr:unnamed protein product [Effrenium voratum]